MQELKKLLIILLTLGLFLQSTSQLWIVSGFMINRDFIAKTSCEKRADPESSCNGACQLKKKIKADTEQQENGNNNAKQKEVNLFLGHYFKINTESNVVATVCDNIYPKAKKEQLCSEYFSSIFHPPAVVVYSI